jgi:predicted nucleic acid-binding protein
LVEASGPIILDTDVASLIIKRRLDPADARLYRYTWCVTFVTVGELVKGASMAAWDLRRRTELSDWLGRVVILPYDIRVSDTWGQLAAAAQLRGRPRPVNDMWIAAASIANRIPLATRNVKDYEDFATFHGLILRAT